MTSGASGVQYMIDNPTAFGDMLSAMSDIINEFPDPEYKEKANSILDSMSPMIDVMTDLTQKAQTAITEMEDLE